MDIALTLGFLTSGFQIPFKRFMAIILLFSPSFVWFYAINVHLFEHRVGVGPSPDWVFIGAALFLLSIVCSGIIGSMISERVNRRRFLGFWIFFGVLTTASFMLITVPFAVFQSPLFFLLLSVLAGTSYGIGNPSCLAFIADSTNVEERARVSGATMLVTFVVLVLLTGITMQLGLLEALFVYVIFRATSFFALLLDPCERVPDKKKKKTWVAVWTAPGFGLYFFSWLMFWVAGSIETFVGSWLPASAEFEAAERLAVPLTWVGTAFAGLISGFVSDRFGRKKAIIFGISTLGISYLLFSAVTNPTSFLITRIFYGASFGIMFSNLFMTAIGDIASASSRERFYIMGGMVFLLYMAIQLFSEIFTLDYSPSVISSILSMILFVAVIPLLYAPETLPREKIRARKFKKYLKKVKEVVEEEETRNHE